MPPSKRPEWTGRAEREYLQALAFIAVDSGARNAALVMQRIERAESLLASNPGIGTPPQGVAPALANILSPTQAIP
ncbi:MAG: type II toxin-antitoxin system RelE/ParE family toxin [Sulfuritalea sp.]|nr:type II toxin-antitoxin system RelE/ParE family toxin [Sulfuritalea sp.]